MVKKGTPLYNAAIAVLETQNVAWPEAVRIAGQQLGSSSSSSPRSKARGKSDGRSRSVSRSNSRSRSRSKSRSRSNVKSHKGKQPARKTQKQNEEQYEEDYYNVKPTSNYWYESAARGQTILALCDLPLIEELEAEDLEPSQRRIEENLIAKGRKKPASGREARGRALGGKTRGWKTEEPATPGERKELFDTLVAEYGEKGARMGFLLVEPAKKGDSKTGEIESNKGEKVKYMFPIMPRILRLPDHRVYVPMRPSLKALNAAYRRAKQYGYTDVAAAAQKIIQHMHEANCEQNNGWRQL